MDRTYFERLVLEFTQRVKKLKRTSNSGSSNVNSETGEGDGVVDPRTSPAKAFRDKVRNSFEASKQRLGELRQKFEMCSSENGRKHADDTCSKPLHEMCVADIMTEMLRISQKDPANVDVAYLKESRVGKYVAKIGKKSKDVSEQNLSKILITYWKQIITEKKKEGRGGRAGDVQPKKRKNTQSLERKGSEERGCKKSRGEEKLLSSSSSGDGVDGVRERSTCVHIFESWVNLPAVRRTTRKLVFKKLRACAVEGASRDDVRSIAEAIEETVFADADGRVDSDHYKRTTKKLIVNLGRNVDLPCKLLKKELLPRTFARMRADEMLTEENRRKRKEMSEKEIRERLITTGLDPNTMPDGPHKCRRCKSRKTAYHEKQTRSADEPMTTFVLCAKCGNRWRY